ncbi:hypothetical protein VCHC57A2_2343, partial [Vibrio cholerae HC-57A2]
MSLRQSQA